MSTMEAFLGQTADDLFVSVASVPDARELNALDVAGQHEARQAIGTAIANAQRHKASAGSRIALVKGEVGSGKTHVLTTALQQAALVPEGEVYPVILQLTAPVTRDTYERWLLQASFREVGARHFSGEGSRSPLRRLADRLLERVETELCTELLQYVQRQDDDEALMRTALTVGKSLREQALEFLVEDPPGAGFIATVILAGYGDWSALTFLRRSHIDLRLEPLGLIPAETPIDRIMVIKDLGMTAQIVGASLAIGFDQVENAVRLGDENLFVHALVQAIRIAESVLNVAILIAVLADEYDRIASGTENTPGLTAGDLFRIERELPSAVRLERPHDEFLRRVVGQRLTALWHRQGIEPPKSALDPLPDWFVPQFDQARSVRGALREVNRFREQAYRLQRMPTPQELGVVTSAPEPSDVDFDKLWADHRDSGSVILDEVSDATKANLMAWWAQTASGERRGGETVEVTQRRAEDEWKTHLVDILFLRDGSSIEERVVALCEAPNRNNQLSQQIEGFLDACNSTDASRSPRPIAVRTKAFPKGATAQPASALERLADGGGLQLELGEIEWHALQEAKTFADGHASDPSFLAWRRDRQWLLQLIPTLSPVITAPLLAH
ncbi:MAG: ATP-binding protein [Myxococcales bacterium]|nr:ATP-binding protein [Myxococcales bacterium]